MIKNFNNRLEMIRYLRALKFNSLIFLCIAFISLSMIGVTYASSLLLSGASTHDTESDNPLRGDGYPTDMQLIGNGHNINVESVKVYARTVTGTLNKNIGLVIRCYNTSNYENETDGQDADLSCSYNLAPSTYDDKGWSLATVTNTAFQEKTLTISGSYVLHPSKYYAIQIKQTGAGTYYVAGSDTDEYANGCYYTGLITIAGYACDNQMHDLWFEIYGTAGSGGAPTFSLINNTGTGADVDDNISFTANYEDYTDRIMRVTLYKNASGTGSLGSQVASYEYTDLASSGSINFSASYDVPGNFTPILAVSNCSNGGFFDDEGVFTGGSYSSTGSFIPNPESCTTWYEEGEQITIGNGSGDIDLLFDFQFEPQLLQQSYDINSNITMDYLIDPDMCASGIFLSRLYLGYPPQYADQDAGIVLSSFTGSINISYPLSSSLHGRFYPYIKLDCNAGGGPKIYNNNTIIAGRASGLWVTSPADAHKIDGTPAVEVGTKGGRSADYDASTGSGAYFFTNKDQYDMLETVSARVYFGVGFSPASVLVYPDILQLPSLSTTYNDASNISNFSEHIYIFSYTQSGSYYPMVEVRSSTYDSGDPSTFRRIYLGGEQYRQIDKYLLITNTVYGSNDFNSDIGIFGLDPSTFNVSLGDSDNVFLQFVGQVANYVIRGGLYVASFIFNIIYEAPFFSMFVEIMNPATGSCYQLSPSLFNTPIPIDKIPDSSYCVSYAPSSPHMGGLIRIFIFGSLIIFIIELLLPHSKKE